MSSRAKKPVPEDVDAYIADSAEIARPKLREVRALIRAAIPKADESISWGVPFYKYCGALIGFAAYKNHVSVGFASAVLSSDERKVLEGFGHTTGTRTLQIQFDQTVPAAAIKRILKAHAKMNETKRPSK